MPSKFMLVPRLACSMAPLLDATNDVSYKRCTGSVRQQSVAQRVQLSKFYKKRYAVWADMWYHAHTLGLGNTNWMLEPLGGLAAVASLG